MDYIYMPLVALFHSISTRSCWAPVVLAVHLASTHLVLVLLLRHGLHVLDGSGHEHF